VALARRILQRPAGVIGFLPAGRGVDVWQVLPRLAAALRVLSPGRFALVRPPALADRPVGRSSAPYRTHRIEEELDELLLPEVDTLAAALGPLGAAIDPARLAYAHILVDVGGFLAHTPEVLELPDVLVSVAVAGVTRERELVELMGFLPVDRHVGTLLVE
jgi:hypothetical protein